MSIPIQSVYYTVRNAPGIDKPAGRAALAGLMASAVAYLTAVANTADFGQFPVFLGATAGMRILDTASRTTIMEEVRDFLSSYPFLFLRPWARVLAGEEEGTYGWIAANYAQGTLFVNATSPDGNVSASQVAISNSTFAALDLGGASTQITFVPPAGVDILSNAYRVALSTTAATTVYTHSYLYYGQNEAIARLNELALAAWVTDTLPPTVSSGDLVPHPCFLTGTPPAMATFNSTVVAPGVAVVFNGTSNATGCRQLASALMLKGAYCVTDPKPTPDPAAVTVPVVFPTTLPPPINPAAGVRGSSCGINGVYQPPLQPPVLADASLGAGGEALAAPTARTAVAAVGAAVSGTNVSFYAFSSFSYIWPFFGVASGAPLSQLQAGVAAFCSLDFTTGNATYYPRTTLPSSIPTYCAAGAFAAALLLEGYGIPADGARVFVPPAGFSYATGAMLTAVNQLAWDYAAAAGGGAASAPAPASVAGWVAGVGVLASALVLGFGAAGVVYLRSSGSPRGRLGSVGRGSVGEPVASTSGGSGISPGAPLGAAGGSGYLLQTDRPPSPAGRSASLRSSAVLRAGSSDVAANEIGMVGTGGGGGGGGPGSQAVTVMSPLRHLA